MFMQEERKKILEMIQDGKLSAEEAMGLLEELDKASQESEAKEQKLQNELSTVVVDKKAKEAIRIRLRRISSHRKKRLWISLKVLLRKSKKRILISISGNLWRSVIFSSMIKIS